MSFRFCSACGTSLPHIPPITCIKCGAGHWGDPIPCAGAVVELNGKVLMVRRAYEPWKDCWDIPSGFLASHEHPIATAKREVSEESGLLINVVGFLGIWLDAYTDEKATLNIYYTAVPAGDINTHPDPTEVTEVKWFAPDRLPDRIAFPCHIPDVLMTWQEANRLRYTVTPLLDRP
jgi:ADP-ribose pyrophosphatase YjhB (NUDIX family)